MLATAVPEGLSVWWWSALGAGLVVALVAWFLLHALLKVVTEIQHGVEAVWETAKQAARNTATTWMLGETARLLEETKEEALKHDALLSARRR
ncbi:MAG TPA: hypothetical protein VHL78_08360 [Actinomycetota bacterium]|nr:hypothetical protein [Actinomycetota bacterium]